MRKYCALIWMIFLMGCAVTPSTSPAGTATGMPTQIVPVPLASPTSEDVYEISAWVNIPEPGPDDIVTVSGHIIKNGVYLGGEMWMFWPEEGGAPGNNECLDHMMYQRGICQIIVKGYPPDIYVPIKVRWEFGGMVLTTETGFTPRSK